jgi:hypothetical protein
LTSINLPSGATAEMLAPGKLKAKHQRAVTRALSSANQREGGFVLDLSDGVLGIVIQSWTCVDEEGQPLPIPSEDLKSLEELELEDYETLLAHPFVAEVSQLLMKYRTEKITADDFDNPNSPSEPSSGSSADLREEQSPKTSRGRSGTTSKSTSRSQSAGAGRRKS